jgi:putative photosynthetic complex assembly protein
MSHGSMERGLPRAPLVGAVALVLAVVVLVVASRLSGPGQPLVDDVPIVAERLLLFVDADDGSVTALDGRTGEVIEIYPAGTNGFLRATMRGLARERRSRGFGPEIPFQLVARADGRLTLDDPATGRRLDLGAFGRTNAATFASLLGEAPSRHADQRLTGGPP